MVALRLCLLALLQQLVMGASHGDLRHRRAAVFGVGRVDDTVNLVGADADEEDGASDDNVTDAEYKVDVGDAGDAGDAAVEEKDAGAIVPDAGEQTANSDADNLVVDPDSAAPTVVAAAATPGKLQAKIKDSVTEVAQGMNVGASLHSTLRKTQVRAMAEDERVKQLRAKVATIREAHDAAEHKLNDIMMPRIHYSEARLAKKHAERLKDDSSFQAWTEKRSQAQDSIAHLSHGQASAEKELADATAAANEALKKEDEAKRKLRVVEHNLGSEKLSYHSLEAKFLAAQGEVEHTRQEEKNLRGALDNARQTYKEEQLKFDHILSAQEKKLILKMNKAQQEKQHAEQNVVSTQGKLNTWKEDQAQKARGVAELKRQFEEAQIADAQRKREQHDKAVEAALDGSDESDWAWDHQA